jgi:hypothetical protein
MVLAITVELSPVKSPITAFLLEIRVIVILSDLGYSFDRLDHAAMTLVEPAVERVAQAVRVRVPESNLSNS